MTSVANTSHPCAAFLISQGVKVEVRSSQFEFISLVLPPRREMSWDVESSGSSRSCHSPTLLRQLSLVVLVMCIREDDERALRNSKGRARIGCRLCKYR